MSNNQPDNTLVGWRKNTIQSDTPHTERETNTQQRPPTASPHHRCWATSGSFDLCHRPARPIARGSLERFFRQVLDYSTPEGWKQPRMEPIPEVIVGVSISLLWAHLLVFHFLGFLCRLGHDYTITWIATAAEAIGDYRSGVLQRF